MIIKSFHQQAKSKSNKLSVIIDKSTPIWVKGDVGKVTQILNNLINNALKFTMNGTVKVNVARIEDTSRVKFDVIDSGIGISEEDSKKIFEAFVQADEQEVNIGDPGSGSGLGLAISKELAELHGGSLSVESKVNVGSTFSLELNLDEGAKPKVVKSSEKEIKSVSFDSPVLIFDDNPLNSFVVCEMVKRLGFNAITEKDSTKVLEVVNEHSPFLILMDIQMPIVDGYQATKMIRKSNKLSKFQLHKIPVIALTADAEPQTKKKALDAGMDDLIVKPFAPAHLELIVNRYASSHQVNS